MSRGITEQDVWNAADALLVEVARAVAFMVSEESGLMTGSIVDFDQSVLGTYESPPHPNLPQAAE